jgi:hypothetical protein
MKHMSKLCVTALMLATFTTGAWTQTQIASNTGPATGTATPAPAATSPTPAPAPPAITTEIQVLKDAIAAQQLQIQKLTEQLERQRQLQEAQQAAISAVEKAPASPPKQVASATVTTNDLDAVSPVQPETSPASNPDDKSSALDKQMESPMTIHFRGVNITPGGFAAGEFVRRSRALGADVITPFNNPTMPGASQSNLSEFFASARQSRATVYLSSHPGNINFSAYVSGDFLSSGLTSTATQSNSYTFRLRQAWGQASFTDGWSILGGQAWSLVTENKVGIAPSDDAGRTNDARPMTIDGQYSVGFTFARQDGLRLTKRFGDKVAVAVAVENAQATVTSSGNTNDYLLVQPGTNNTNNSTSTYGFNPSPDLIAKIAFDPGFGHYEVFGLYDRFQDRIFPCEWESTGTPTGLPSQTFVSPTCTGTPGTAAGAFNSSKNGGGIGANARWTFFNKRIVFGLHGFGGSGIGRYGASQLPDVSVNADGTIHLVKNLQGLATLEWHGKKLDVYSYVGSEYAQRTYSFDPEQYDAQVYATGSTTPFYVGYGAPTFRDDGCYTEAVPTTGTLTGTTIVPGSLAHCSSQTRDVTEGTIGFWYRIHSGDRGRYQVGMQYSYLNRSTWADEIHGLEPHGLDSMVFASFRYYLP